MEIQRHPDKGSEESKNRWGETIQRLVENVKIHGNRVGDKYNLTHGNYYATESDAILVHAGNTHVGSRFIQSIIEVSHVSSEAQTRNKLEK